MAGAKAAGTDGGKAADPSAKNTDSIITDGSHIYKGKLKPNVTYQTGENNYIYETNGDGLIVRARTDDLQVKKHDKRLTHDGNTYDKRPGDHAGHLFGDRFGGSPKLDNLVSQAKDVNLKDYKHIENDWDKAIKQGEKVTVDIKIGYPPGEKRPSFFDVCYTIGKKIFHKHIDN